MYMDAEGDNTGEERGKSTSSPEREVDEPRFKLVECVELNEQRRHGGLDAAICHVENSINQHNECCASMKQQFKTSDWIRNVEFAFPEAICIAVTLSF
jgi:hypothetical protein